MTRKWIKSDNDDHSDDDNVGDSGNKGYDDDEE